MKPSPTAALSATLTIVAALSVAACSSDPAAAAVDTASAASASTSTSSSTASTKPATSSSSSSSATKTPRRSTSTGAARKTPAGYYDPKILDPKTGKIDICRVRQDPFTGKAAEKFGAKDVMAAYCEIGNFALNEGFTDIMETKQTHRPVEFAFVKPWLTPDAQKSFDAQVAGAIKHQKAPYESLNAWMGLDMEGGGYSFSPKYPRATHQAVKPALAWVDGERLALRITTTADLVVVRDSDGTVGTAPISRTIDYALIRNGTEDKPWLIDGWNGKWKHEAWSPGLS